MNSGDLAIKVAKTEGLSVTTVVSNLLGIRISVPITIAPDHTFDIFRCKNWMSSVEKKMKMTLGLSMIECNGARMEYGFTGLGLE